MSAFKLVFLGLTLVALFPVQAVSLYSPLVINEVDYDQPGTTDDGEFIELKNVSQKTVDIKGYSLILWDGANPPGAQIVELEFTTSADIPPDGYFVMCGAEDTTRLSSEVCNRYLPSGWKISNDKRDGIRLVKDGAIVDSMTWVEYLEGTTEGTGPAPRDLDTKEDFSLSRTPDGLDTDDNAFDFKWTCASPHRANYTDNECFCLHAICPGGMECNPESGACETVIVPEDIIEDTGTPDNGGPDVAVVDAGFDNGSGEDAAQPSDTAYLDFSSADAAPRDTARPETGPGLDAAHWLDLPVHVDDVDGEDEYDKGCTAGRSPGNAVAIMIVLFAGMACLIRRRRRSSTL